MASLKNEDAFLYSGSQMRVMTCVQDNQESFLMKQYVDETRMERSDDFTCSFDFPPLFLQQKLSEIFISSLL